DIYYCIISGKTMFLCVRRTEGAVLRALQAYDLILDKRVKRCENAGIDLPYRPPSVSVCSLSSLTGHS
ncbi:hypothetical protein, partial [Pseudomonas syringae]|uniref:hypothetical protein n=1 Tax=Pseudomonas syringae TaxID=317 RepID=UPI001E5E3CCA